MVLSRRRLLKGLGIATLAQLLGGRAAASMVVQSGSRKFGYSFPVNNTFPLSVDSGGRYLITAGGVPFQGLIDTAWSLMVQYDNAGVDAYIASTAAKGFRGVIANLIEHNFSNNTPKSDNVDGDAPFTDMNDWTTFNTPYWTRVTRAYDGMIAAGMVPVFNPAYLGYSGTEEGWDTEVAALSDANLQAYGAELKTRYPYAMWCFGGDQDPGTTLRNKQLQIFTGIRSVSTANLMTGHGAPYSPSFSTWGGTTGYNIHTSYPGDEVGGTIYALNATEVARSPAKPVFMFEARYEQERSPAISAAGLRRQSLVAWLSGASLVGFGNSPIWHGGSTNAPFSWSGTVASNLDSTGRQHQANIAALMAAYSSKWLQPKTDTSLVSSSLSSGDSRICPALATDGSYALIWVPSSQSVTCVMSALTPSSVRARLFNPSDGSYSTVSGSPFANSGTQSIATGGERVIVLDAA